MGRISWDSFTIRFFEILFDFSIIGLSYFMTLYFYFNQSMLFVYRDFSTFFYFSITLGLLALINLFVYRVYRVSILKESFKKTIHKLFIGLMISAFSVYLITFIILDYSLPKQAIWYALIAQIGFLFIVKFITFKIVIKHHNKTALVMGPKEAVGTLLKKLLKDGNPYIKLKYLVHCNEDLDMNDVYNLVEEVDFVYLTSDADYNVKKAMTNHCLSHHKTLYLMPNIFELILNQSFTEAIGDELVNTIKPLGLTIEQRFLKRSFDLTVSIMMLIVSSPVMLLIALVIKLYDRGPILFRQERVTRDQKVFTLFKFRTMIPDAEKSTGPVQASINDHRITPFGRFLRSTRLDELPQLINVITGQMSFVGPRALRVEEVNDFVQQDERFAYRFTIKSGITGYAQINGYYHTNFKEKLKLDIFYIINYSFLLDLVILVLTVRSVFDRHSAEGLQ